MNIHLLPFWGFPHSLPGPQQKYLSIWFSDFFQRIPLRVSIFVWAWRHASCGVGHTNMSQCQTTLSRIQRHMANQKGYCAYTLHIMDWLHNIHTYMHGPMMANEQKLLQLHCVIPTVLKPSAVGRASPTCEINTWTFLPLNFLARWEKATTRLLPNTRAARLCVSRRQALLERMTLSSFEPGLVAWHAYCEATYQQIQLVPCGRTWHWTMKAQHAGTASIDGWACLRRKLVHACIRFHAWAWVHACLMHVVEPPWFVWMCGTRAFVWLSFCIVFLSWVRFSLNCMRELVTGAFCLVLATQQAKRATTTTTTTTTIFHRVLQLQFLNMGWMKLLCFRKNRHTIF